MKPTHPEVAKLDFKDSNKVAVEGMNFLLYKTFLSQINLFSGYFPVVGVPLPPELFQYTLFINTYLHEQKYHCRIK